ncbi:hypothetical protein F5Y11DRAFT_36867 [Daldinia sp. FL1419]|nr:hypothetical protein F5Y11DRAFT_36867 [Daldinia sp. FL1419]
MSVFTGTIILCVIAGVLTIFVYVIYFFGHHMRRVSKFAQTLAEAEAEAEAQTHPGHELEDNNSREISSNQYNARVSESIDEEDAEVGSLPDIPHVDRIVHFLPPESLPGSRAGSRYPSAANTPNATRPSSIDLENLAIYPPHGANLSPPVPAKLVPAPAHSQNTNPAGEASSSDNISKLCSSCSSALTLSKACSLCAKKSTGPLNTEDVSPTTSLREVENAELAPATGASPAAIPPPAAEAPAVVLSAEQPKGKKRRFSGTCYLM